MPFTLAHPAAVLPVQRIVPEAPAIGLVIGSITPDLVYFLPLGVTGAQSHSAFGLLWFCIPMGVGAWLVFTGLLAPAFERFLPSGVAARLCRMRLELSWRRIGAVGGAILVGAATHVAWDSFTHSTGAVVQAFPYLRQNVPVTVEYSPALYTVLQHVSTVLGLTVLLIWCGAWYRRTPARHSPGEAAVHMATKAAVVAAVLLPAAVAACVVLVPAVLHETSTLAGVQRAIGRAAFASGSAFLTALFAVALIIRVVTSGRRGEGAA